MSATVPMPSHRGHIPPRTLKVFLVFLPLAVFATPAPSTDGTLNENAFEVPMYGVDRRLNRIRSIALMSVMVPTVDRGFPPIRSWSTMIAVVRPERTSTSGRPSDGMKPCTNAL